MISLSGTGLDALAHRIQQEVDTGNITAAQLAIGLDGQVAHFQSFGTATTTDRFIIFSATKALVAMALLPHFADGTLDLTTPVAHYLPEFGHRARQCGGPGDGNEVRGGHAQLVEQRLFVQTVLRHAQGARARIHRHPTRQKFEAARRDVLEIESDHVRPLGELEQGTLAIVGRGDEFPQRPGTGIGGRIEKHKAVRPGMPGHGQHARQLAAADDADCEWHPISSVLISFRSESCGTRRLDCQPLNLSLIHI